MKTANQLTFIHPLVSRKYSSPGTEGYDPISLFKAHLLIYLGEVSSDHDAQWGAKSKGYIFFGDKVHLIVDAKSQLPLDVRVTPVNEGDCPQAKPLLKGAKKWHPQVKIDSSFMEEVCRQRRVNISDLSFAEQNVLWEEAKRGVGG